MAGVELNHVPYKGSGPAMQDLISGQVSVSFAGIPNVLGHVKSGRLRAAGVEATVMAPEPLGAFIRSEHEKWGRVVRETGATVN